MPEHRRLARTTRTMTIAAAPQRPNRLLVALAAAWMILSLAIGGAVTAESRADASGTTAEQPAVVAEQ